MNRIEKKAYQILLNQGYLVEKPRRVKWLPQDYFNCFDFIAVNDKEIRFIQVSKVPWTRRNLEYRERFENFPCPPNCRKEYWTFNRKTGDFEIKIIERKVES